MWGRPSIATHVGGMPELVQHDRTGLLVPVDNAQALERAIVDLLQDDQRRDALGRAAREVFVARHEQRRMAESAERFYRSLELVPVAGPT